MYSIYVLRLFSKYILCMLLMFDTEIMSHAMKTETETFTTDTHYTLSSNSDWVKVVAVAKKEYWLLEKAFLCFAIKKTAQPKKISPSLLLALFKLPLRAFLKVKMNGKQEMMTRIFVQRNRKLFFLFLCP